jgi:hypothetical protein
MERIQPDFSIKLNNVQLLKKFHNQHIDNIFSDLISFNDSIFIINVLEDSIYVTPYFDDRTNKYFGGWYSSPKYEKLKNFLKFQLINSGVISTLRNIEIKTYHGKLFMGYPRKKRILLYKTDF